jgi:hypothetical protein
LIESGEHMKRIKSRKRYSMKVATLVVATASVIVACGRNVNNGGFRPRKNGTSTLGIYPGKPGPGSFATLSPEQKSLRLRQIIAKVLLGKSDAEVNDLEGLNRLLPESAADIILGVSAELGKAGSSVDQQRGQTDPASVVARESLLRSNISAVIGPESQAKSVVVSGEFQSGKTQLNIKEGDLEFRAACYEGCENFVVFISSGEAKAGFIFKINNETGSGQIVASTLGSRLRTFEDAKKLVAAREGVARTIVEPPIPPGSGDTLVPPAVVEGTNTGDSTQEIPPPDGSTGDQAPPTGEMGPPPPPVDGDKVTPTPPPPPVDGDKVTPTPPPPAADGDKVTPTPPPPPVDGDKVTPTPPPPAADGDKVTPTPPPPAADGDKVTPTPPPPAADEDKVTPTPPPGGPSAPRIRKYGVVYSSGPSATPEKKASEDDAPQVVQPPPPAARDLAEPEKQPPVTPPKKPLFIVSETWDKMKALTRQGIQAVIAAVPKSQMGGDFDQSLSVYTSLTGTDPNRLNPADKKALLELFQQHYHDTFALRIPYFQISLDRSSNPATIGVDLAISENGLDLRKRTDEGMNVALDADVLKGKTVTMDIKDVNGSPSDVRISMRCISNCKEVVSELWFGENSESKSFTLRSAGLYKFEADGNNGPMKLTYSTPGYSWSSRRFDSLIGFETVANDCVAKVGNVKECPASTEPAGSTALDSAKLCEIDNGQLLKQKEICSKMFKDSVSAGFLEIYKGLSNGRRTEPSTGGQPQPDTVNKPPPSSGTPSVSQPPLAAKPNGGPRKPKLNRPGDLKAGQGKNVPPRIVK